MRTLIAVLVLLSILLFASGCGIEGLHNAKPITIIRFDPASRSASFSDSKDNDVTIDELTYSPATGFMLKGLVLRNNSSDVRLANYQQMMGMAQQAQVNWAGASDFTGSLFSGLASVMPFLPKLAAAKALGNAPRAQSISTPMGTLTTGGGLTEAQVQALLAIAGTQVPEPAPPATQPVE